jgi:hypothetical protein
VEKLPQRKIRRPDRRTAGSPLKIVAIASIGLVVVVAGAIPGGDAADAGPDATPRASKKRASKKRARLFVDRNSLGGRCDDDRTASQVQTAATPWCSLERAVAAAPAGAVVLVREGTYARLEVDFRSPQRDDYLTLRPYGSERVALDGFKTSNTSHLRLQGFRITDWPSIYLNSRQIQLIGCDISPHGLDVRAGSSDILIEDNYFHDISRTPDAFAPDGYGIRASGGNDRIDNLTIRGNRFARLPLDAIQLGALYGATIEGNDIRQISAKLGDPTDHTDAIHILGASGFVIRNNYISDADMGMLLEWVSNVQVTNNVFARSDAYGTQVGADRPGLAFVNNTYWDNGFGGLLINPSEGISGDSVVKNNIFDVLSVPLTAGYENYNLVRSGDRRGANDIAGPPTFATDYQLAPGSAGIDAAVSDGAPTQDRLGRPRVDDPATPNSGGGSSPFYDMGAYENP